MFKTVMQASQQDLIVRHLIANGSISGVEASAMFKVRDISRTMRYIRAKGYKITTERKVDSCGQRYTRYFLDKKASGTQLELNLNA